MQPTRPNASKGPSLVLRESTSEWSAATFGNVMVTVMWKRGTATQMRRLRQIHDGWYKEHPQGIATFNIVLPSTLIPEQDSHAVAAEALAAMQGHHLASTTVILGDGFWAATMRSMLTTVFALSRSRVPQRVVATIDEGATHQSKLLGENGPASAEFARACQALVAQHEARA